MRHRPDYVPRSARYAPIELTAGHRRARHVPHPVWLLVMVAVAVAVLAAVLALTLDGAGRPGPVSTPTPAPAPGPDAVLAGDIIWA